MRCREDLWHAREEPARVDDDVPAVVWTWGGCVAYNCSSGSGSRAVFVRVSART
jgi:hypothetical protein